MGLSSKCSLKPVHSLMRIFATVSQRNSLSHRWSMICVLSQLSLITKKMSKLSRYQGSLWKTDVNHTRSEKIIIFLLKHDHFRARALKRLTSTCQTFQTTVGQDKFIRDSLTEDDILVVDVGGNDVALRPTCGIILNMALLLYLTPTCLIRCCPWFVPGGENQGRTNRGENCVKGCSEVVFFASYELPEMVNIRKTVENHHV